MGQGGGNRGHEQEAPWLELVQPSLLPVMWSPLRLTWSPVWKRTMNSGGVCCIVVAYVPLGRSKAQKNSLFWVIRVEWCICFLSILKQKSSLCILNSSISLGKAFVYFSACKIHQNKSMGNRKPCVIHRTSITSSASSLPMFHQFTLLKAGRLDFILNKVERFALVYKLDAAVSL